MSRELFLPVLKIKKMKSVILANDPDLLRMTYLIVPTISMYVIFAIRYTHIVPHWSGIREKIMIMICCLLNAIAAMRCFHA